MVFNFYFLLAFGRIYPMLIYAQSIGIEYTWNDTNTGWINTNEYINGTLATYHGWFAFINNIDIWYRNFSCEHYSTVTVNFVCNYGCEVEFTGLYKDYCILYFDDPSHSNPVLEVAYNDGLNSDLTNLETQLPPCTGVHNLDHSLSATAVVYTNTTLYLPNQVFEVAFQTYASDTLNENLGISFISLVCNQVPTSVPTSIPTFTPTLQTPGPTSETPLPTLDTIGPTPSPTGDSNNPTVQPTIYPTDAPSTNPTMNPSGIYCVICCLYLFFINFFTLQVQTYSPSKNPSSLFPSNIPSTQPTSQPSSLPTSQPSNQPTSEPSIQSSQPSNQPTSEPSVQPTSLPSSQPTNGPFNSSNQTIVETSYHPLNQSTSEPTNQPSMQPSQTTTQSMLPTNIIISSSNPFNLSEGTSIDITIKLVFIAILIIMSILFIICCVSFIHKSFGNLPCFMTADDAKVLRVLAFALQMLDFSSDINFTLALSVIAESFLFPLSLIFLFLPWTLNVIWLLIQRKSWSKHPIVNGCIYCLAQYFCCLSIVCNCIFIFCFCLQFGFAIMDGFY